MQDLSSEDKLYFHNALCGKPDPSSPYERKGNVIIDKRDKQTFGVMDDYSKVYASRISDNVFDGASPDMYRLLLDSLKS